MGPAIATLLTLGFAGVAPAVAALRVLDVPAAFKARILEMVAADDGGLWLLLRRGESGPPTFSVGKVSKDWRIQSEADLGDGDYAELKPFGTGYLLRHSPPLPQPTGGVHGYPRREFDLLSFDGETGNGRPLHVWNASVVDAPVGQFVPNADSSAVYVVESERLQQPGREDRYRTRLLKIDRNGRTVWQRDSQEGRFRKMVVTPRGPVLAFHQAIVERAHGNYSREVLAALSPDGELLWRRPVLLKGADRLEYLVSVAPDRLALAAHPPPHSGLAVQVVNLDTLEMQRWSLPRSDYSVPRLRSIPGGLLYAGLLMNQPYLSSSSPDGTVRWWRRLNMTERRYSGVDYCATPDAQALRGGGLAVLTECRDRQGWRTQLFRTDADAKELGAAYDHCVAFDPVPIVELEQRLYRAFGVSVTPAPYGDEAARPAGPCGEPSDRDYLSFLATFYRSLTDLGAPRLPYGIAPHVVVGALDEPYRLNDYALGLTISDSPRTFLAYRARADAAGALATHIAQVAAPDMLIAVELREAFLMLTGHALSARRRFSDSASGPEYMERIVEAERKILAEARELTPQELKWVKASRRVYGFEFGPDEFWPYGQQHAPIGDARKTILTAAGYSAPGR